MHDDHKLEVKNPPEEVDPESTYAIYARGVSMLFMGWSLCDIMFLNPVRGVSCMLAGSSLLLHHCVGCLPEEIRGHAKKVSVYGGIFSGVIFGAAVTQTILTHTPSSNSLSK